MRVPGLKSLQQLLRWLRSRVLDHAIILGYHRIGRAPWDPYSLCVSPERFEEQLSLLQRVAEPLALPVLVERMRSGERLQTAVAITFDDGYSDILYHAKPLLEAYEIPATVFVTAGDLGREFWWDELSRLVYSLPGSSDRLELRSQGRALVWELAELADNAPARDVPEQLLDGLFQYCLSLSADERSAVLSQLREQAGEKSGGEPWHRSLDASELAELSEGPLIEIGSHSMTHPVMTSVRRDNMEREIRESRNRLQEIVDRQVVSFSFPNGIWTSEALEFLRQSGFLCACVSDRDVVTRYSHPYRLPRFWVEDHSATDFRVLLERWAGGLTRS